MQHYGTEDDGELTPGKGQRLRSRIREIDLEPGLPCLLTRPRDHLPRCVDPMHGTVRSDLSLGRDCKTTCPATHIQHGFARCEADGPQDLRAKSALPAQRQQPDQKVVARSPMQQQAGSARRYVSTLHAPPCFRTTAGNWTFVRFLA